MIKALALSISLSLTPCLSIYLSVSSLSGCKIKPLLINCTRQNVITQISTELLGGQFLILNFSFTLYSIYCISFHGFDQYFIKSSVERNIECRIFKLFYNLLQKSSLIQGYLMCSWHQLNFNHKFPFVIRNIFGNL